MKYYMLNPYKDIPQYAEIEMIGHCYDSGYSCWEVKYMGRIYKPLERDVIDSQTIEENLKRSREKYQKNLVLKSMTLGSI